MREWLRRQNWYWNIYYEAGIQIGPKPIARKWNVLLLPDMAPPPERPGYVQNIVRPKQLFSEGK